jgi:hypothetical protein
MYLHDSQEIAGICNVAHEIGWQGRQMIYRRTSFELPAPKSASKKLFAHCRVLKLKPPNQTFAMPPKAAKRSEVRRKTETVLVRVTPSEKQTLKSLASVSGLTVPELLRQSTLNKTPLEIIDKGPLRDLLRVSADLGRLGGLFKLWLSEYGLRDQKEELKRQEIRSLLYQIAETNKLLKEKIRAKL